MRRKSGASQLLIHGDSIAPTALPAVSHSWPTMSSQRHADLRGHLARARDRAARPRRRAPAHRSGAAARASGRWCGSPPPVDSRALAGWIACCSRTCTPTTPICGSLRGCSAPAPVMAPAAPGNGCGGTGPRATSGSCAAAKSCGRCGAGARDAGDARAAGGGRSASPADAGRLSGRQARASGYFAGDTDLFPEMHDLRGRVDVALLPVWGWGPRARGGASGSAAGGAGGGADRAPDRDPDPLGHARAAPVPTPWLR